MLNIFKKYFDPNIRAIKEVTPIVDEIFSLESKVAELSLAEMQTKVATMRTELSEIIKQLPQDAKDNIKAPRELSPLEKKIRAKLQSYLPEFFAYMREVNKRKFKKPHFRVQVIAGVILAQGHKLTELKTGEGKTQVFHLPAALYGLTGRGSHVVTVNDYLARRDGEYAGHAMADLGISVGIITPQASYKFVKDDDLLKIKGEAIAKERETINVASMSDMRGINLVECTKQEAYAQDVLYATNNELGFDYLRDNMSYRLNDRVQKELYYCIVDEADSILIDEARTPLIISAPAEESNELYAKFATIIPKLNPASHYTVDEKSHSATLTEDGITYVEQLLNVKNIWEDYSLAHHLDNALKAETLYKNNEEYIVKNGEVLIVDEFTGRILPGRRYSEGLHQAIEAKEGVSIKQESKTLATITFQNYFRIYKVLSGGSGTIMTEAEEFAKIYGLESYQIPTNKPLIRDDKTDKVYKHKQAKFNAVVEDIIEINKTKQPILIGTATIEDSEFISNILDKKGIIHDVLNAKFHEREAAIVAKAGQLGAITVATNMAGRGTDIPLAEEVKALGGLYIIGTQRHEARRIDNQLRGRAGRQGDPGVSQFYVALDDEIMRIQGGDMVQKVMEMTKIPDDMPIQSGMISKAIESAQKKMEGHHFDIRKRVVDYDDVINQQREIFYAKRLSVVKLTENTDNSAETVEMIKKILVDTVLDIVSKYYIETELDEVSRKNLINEFKDFADDTVIITEYKKLNKTEDFNTFVGKASLSELESLFIELIEKIADLKLEEFGNSLSELYKITSLQIMDELWTEHLDVMTDLREGIGLRGYAQRDPLVEYKNEAFGMFEAFIAKINSQVARRLLKIRRVARQLPQATVTTNTDEIKDVNTGSREMDVVKVTNAGSLLERTRNISLSGGSTTGSVSSKTKTTKLEVGRNEPCPCGSGLKYKKCGLINSTKHKA